MPPPLHAVIISWDGFGTRAGAIAAALAPAVDRLTVIWSNAAGTPEDGPGTWVEVPQSWYFGRKFAAALEQVGSQEIQLQIQADVEHDDWPALAGACAAAFAAHPEIGIWGPDLDWTPWPTALVDEGPLSDGAALRRVTQSDGVVWALAPAVQERLRDLDYTGNNMGWGIDWAAVGTARQQGLDVVRDLDHRVHHPQSRGYHGGKAAQQMKSFLSRMPGPLQAGIMTLHDRLQAKKTAHPEVARDHPAAESTRHPISESFKHMIRKSSSSHQPAQIVLCDRAVYARAGEDFLSAAPCVNAGRQEISFSRLAERPALDFLARSFPLGAEGAGQQLDDLGEWQVSSWSTLRVVADPGAGPRRLPLGGALALGAGDGALDLLVDLACHRARGALVAVLSDGAGKRLGEHRVAFDTETSGGADPAGYQAVRLALPARDTPQTLTLELDYAGPAHPDSPEPHVFFVARPRVVRRGGGRLLTPIDVQMNATAQADTWYKADLAQAADPAREGLALTLSGNRTRLMDADRTALELLNNWGAALQFRADAARQCTVWINGAPEFTFPLQAGTNFMRLPQNVLTGTHARMELRDPAGMVVYWSDWLLLPRQITPSEVLQNEGATPVPCDIFPQTPLRFQAFRAHVAAGTGPEDMAQLARALEALEAGHEALRLKPLKFPQVEAPDVSIVIPAHNKVRVTYAGLCALLLAWNRASFEVILVDDASTDETAEIEQIAQGITVVRNTESQRFIRACNAGAAQARGDYVVLLNNDTEPTVGWLDEMIDAFHRFPDVGLTGSKLLYPDGKLQDAGGIVWGTGDPWNYGNRQNPWEPRFCYARQADYLSGAAMMTTRAIWEEVGGLSTYLEPMYFEDTDFAFKVREAGYTTWLIPSSLVYHYEGMTSGTDTSSGFKRFQEVNRPKFKRRWARAYAKGSKPGTAPDLEKDRGIVGRVLFVDYATPTPDQSAGSYAALKEIRLVQSLGYKVTFLPENLAYFGKYTEALQKMGVEVITAPFHQSVEDFLQERGNEFDAFYITRYHVVNNVVPTIRAVNPQARVIMNNADLHYLRLLRKAVAEDDETQKETARDVQSDEFAAMNSVDLVLSYNEMEHAVIEAQSEGGVRVMPCPWVLDIPESTPPREGRAGLSFLGGFQHHPNVEGAEWFAHSVMSRLETARPDLELSIYGSRMGARIRELASPVIAPVGFVEEISDAYDRHMAFVAPLLSGAGIKGKVLSALAHGIPCVLSPLAAEGIGLLDGRDCLIANTPAEWETAIIRLYDDAALWEKIVGNARELARTRFSFERGREQMRAALEEIGLFAHLGHGPG